MLDGTILYYFYCSLSDFHLQNQQESPLRMKIITGVEHKCLPPASPSSSHFTDTFIVTWPSSTQDGRLSLFYTAEVDLASSLFSMGLLGLGIFLLWWDTHPSSLAASDVQWLRSPLSGLREKVVVRPDFNISFYRKTTQKWKEGRTVHLSLQKQCSKKTNTVSCLFQKLVRRRAKCSIPCFPQLVNSHVLIMPSLHIPVYTDYAIFG